MKSILWLVRATRRLAYTKLRFNLFFIFYINETAEIIDSWKDFKTHSLTLVENSAKRRKQENQVYFFMFYIIIIIKQILLLLLLCGAEIFRCTEIFFL